MATLRRRYRCDARPVVGISWHSTNEDKELPDYTAWAATLGQIGATFVSLQYGEAETEAGIAGIAQAGGPAILRDPEVDAFNDIDGLAAQIVALDAVLTISNTAAHLAGALGQRTAVLLDGRPHLVWPYLGDRTPWYRRLRLARPSPGRPALERGRDMVTRWIA